MVRGTREVMGQVIKSLLLQPINTHTRGNVGDALRDERETGNI